MKMAGDSHVLLAREAAMSSTECLLPTFTTAMPVPGSTCTDCGRSTEGSLKQRAVCLRDMGMQDVIL